MNIENSHGVSLTGRGEIMLLIPPMKPMSKEEALVMAAWIVLLADPLLEIYPAIVEAIENT